MCATIPKNCLQQMLENETGEYWLAQVQLESSKLFSFRYATIYLSEIKNISGSTCDSYPYWNVIKVTDTSPLAVNE